MEHVNDAPLAVNDIASLTEGKSVAVNVLANDHDVDGDALSVSQANVTSGNGTVTVNNAGNLVVTYTGADLDPGEKATVTVQYGATDGSLSDGGTLRVSVTGVAEPGDDINGTPKNDTLNGTNVAERIFGFDGNDVINGRAGDDIISAGAGSDKISGGDDNDRIGGGDGGDVINGGNGNDEISGWAGNDKLTGGSGADTFIFHRLDGSDTITDFEAGGKNHDMIDLQSLTGINNYKQVLAIMTEVGNDVIIDVSDHNDITIKNVELGDLTKDHFQF